MSHNAEYYALVLRNYNLCMRHELGILYTDIELNSIEEFVQLQKDLDEDLILCRNGDIEIYDDYHS